MFKSALLFLLGITVTTAFSQSEKLSLRDFFNPNAILDFSVEAQFNKMDDTLRVAQLIMPAAGRLGESNEKIEGYIKKRLIGGVLLLNGTMLTGRDAAHKRMVEMFARGESLPEGVDLKGKFIYYVGPVDAVRDEVIGPAGPTTATRMDKFTETILAKTGLLGMIGKAERGQAGIDAIQKHKAVYLMAVGGAAYLVSKAIREAKIVAFHDLGMEAIHEFVVEDMPVTVAVDVNGTSVHRTGPAEWQAKIAAAQPITVK